MSSLASHMGSDMHDRRIGVLAALFDAPLVLLLARQAVAGRSTGAAVIERYCAHVHDLKAAAAAVMVLTHPLPPPPPAAGPLC